MECKTGGLTRDAVTRRNTEQEKKSGGKKDDLFFNLGGHLEPLITAVVVAHMTEAKITVTKQLT